MVGSIANTQDLIGVRLVEKLPIWSGSQAAWICSACKWRAAYLGQLTCSGRYAESDYPCGLSTYKNVPIVAMPPDRPECGALPKDGKPGT